VVAEPSRRASLAQQAGPVVRVAVVVVVADAAARRPQTAAQVASEGAAKCACTRGDAGSKVLNQANTRSPARWAKVALVLAVACAILCAQANAEEAVCTSLGANCVCSEPLNTSNYSAGGCGGSENPDDSTVKPCNSTCTLYNASNWTPISSSGFELPGGVSYIGQRGPENGVGAQLEFNSTSETSNTRRVCARFYTRYSADYDAKGANGCQANKFAEFSWGGSNAALHWDWAESTQERFTIINMDADGDNVADASYNLSKTGTLTIEDCRNQWCYAEICASGNIQAGTAMYGEGHVRGVEDGKVADWAKTYVGEACPAGSCTGGDLTAAFINSYRQNTCAGNRYVSHAMMAQWDTDSNQFIGPASEVESAAPVANFTGTPLSGTVPLSVAMTDTSTNTPTSWAWDCDTTVPSTDFTTQNPTCVYSTPGTYTVSLTANNAGGSDAEVKTGYVTANAVASGVLRSSGVSGVGAHSWP